MSELSLGEIKEEVPLSMDETVYPLLGLSSLCSVLLPPFLS